MLSCTAFLLLDQVKVLSTLIQRAVFGRRFISAVAQIPYQHDCSDNHHDEYP